MADNTHTPVKVEIVEQELRGAPAFACLVDGRVNFRCRSYDRVVANAASIVRAYQISTPDRPVQVIDWPLELGLS